MANSLRIKLTKPTKPPSLLQAVWIPVSAETSAETHIRVLSTYQKGGHRIRAMVLPQSNGEHQCDRGGREGGKEGGRDL